jgi:hypothetical protein
MKNFSLLFREGVKNSVPAFHGQIKQEWVDFNFLQPLLNFKTMRKVQRTNLPKFWQKQAKTFVNLVGVLILFTGIANAQVPDLLIQATSNASNIRSQTTGVAVDGSGSIYSVGLFSGSVTFGSTTLTSDGDRDIFLVKYDNSGGVQWVKRAGGTGADVPNGIAVSGSDIYVGGNFRQTANFNNPSASGSNELSTIAIPGDAFVAVYSIAALPIELLSFKGQHTERGNLLTWTTTNEIQNKGFDIETSKDGIRFDKIGFVAGNGTSSQVQNYRFEDYSPLKSAGKAVYYRLKQLDFDGNFDYSNIISIRTNSKTVIGISPNPSAAIFTLTGVKDIEDETFTIMNSVGQTLPLVVQGNGQFDMSSFPPGIYYLRISSSGQVMKLVKE